MNKHHHSSLLVILFLFGFSAILTAQTGLIGTVAGTGAAGTAGVGGPAVNAQLTSPGGICLDSSNNLYIADTGNNRVVRVDAATGTLTLVAGNGIATYSGDSGPAVQASLYGPFSVALDPAGNLFISERQDSRIRRVDAVTGIITTVVGNGTSGFSGDGGPAGNAQLSYPAGISFDSSGNLYIADMLNQRIRRVDAQTKIISTVAGNGMSSVAPDGSVAVNASLAQPAGIAVDRSGNLFITEYGSNSIRRVDAMTGVLTTVAGNGGLSFTGDAIPATQAAIGRVIGDVAVDSTGNLYFADGTGRIRGVDAATGMIGTVAGNGSGAQGTVASGGGGGGSACISTVAGDNGPASAATLDGAIAVALAGNGNLLLSDYLDCRIRRVALPSPYPYTTTILTGTTGTITAGQQVTFTVTVSPIQGSGVPTGTIQLVDAPSPLSQQVIATAQLQNGAITFWMTGPPSGTHNVVAYYSGDGSFNGSGSAGLPLTVSNLPVPTVALSSSANPVLVNASTTLTVRVTPPSGNSNQPTGTVQILDGSTVLTTGYLAAGTLQYTATFATTGTHSLRAAYGGDGNFAQASATLNQVVQGLTNVTLTANPNPATANSPVAFTAAITPSTATGTVQFIDGSTVLGTATVAGGTATFSISGLSLGVHSIQAAYSGDSANGPTSSGILSLTVRTASTTALSSSAAPSTYGSAVTFTAAVSSQSATGTVQFLDGTTVLGSASVSLGSAQFSISTLTGGTHSITATYSGDSANSGSTSAPLAQTVSPATPVITISTMNNPTTVGGFVLFAMSITPYSPGAVLQVMDGNTVLGTVTTSSTGAASFSTTSLTAGYHSITASWAGDGNVLPGVSPVLSEQIQCPTTMTAVASGPVTFGQSVTITATVSPATATGNVQFNDAGTNLGTFPLVNGVASVTYVPSMAGSREAVASFVDPNNIYFSNGAGANFNVARFTPTITLAATPNPTDVGQTVTFTVTAPALPDGTNIDLYDGTTFLNVWTLKSGTAVVYNLMRTAGNHSMTASYGGNVNYAPVTSAAVVEVVKTITTTTVSSPGTSTYGQPVQFVASVTPSAATGTVQFMDGTTPLGTAAVAAGSASLSISTLAAGSHTITAIYSGDSAYDASTSAAFTQTVQKAGVTVAVAGSANPSVAGQTITLTASLSDPAATGTIQFLDGATVLGTATVSGGSAAFSTAALSAGSHSITATYSGDANYNGGSASLSQVVKAVTTTVLAANPPAPVFGQAVQLTASVTPAAATGTVQFLDGSTALGTAPVANGSASLSVSTLAVGAHNFTAMYSGDSNDVGSTSAALALTVSKASSTATLSSAPNPGTFGQAITFTAAISPNTATGSVQFLDAGTVMGTSAVSNGSASLAVATLTAGTHAITAVYSGDANYAGATSTAVSQSVTKASSSVSLISSPNPSTYGQAVTLTAAISPNSATGTVQFFDGGAAIGTAAVAGGTASLTVSTLTAGTHSLTAVYAGDNNYTGATSGTAALTVNKMATTVAIASSANPGTSGQPVTFTAMVSPGSATGSVQFLDGASVIGTASVMSGVASFTTSSLAVGSHAISASYSGDANYSPSASAALTEAIKAATATTLTSNSNPTTYGHSVQFTATVSPSAATGSVQFLDGGVLIGTGTVSNGKATFSTSTLAGGAHTITAAYSGDATYLGSASAALTETVNKANSTSSVASSLNPALVGQAVTLTATVSPSSATGSVEFLDGTTVLATVDLSGASAAFTTSSLAAGSHKITVQYSGDQNYSPDTSSALTQNVNKANTSIALTTSLNPSPAGQTVTFTATVSSAGATGTVQFFDGNSSLGTVPVSSGAAALATSALSPGNHNIKAVYSGDNAFNGSNSQNLKQVVN